MQDIWDELLQWTSAGRPLALARVIQTWGSSPRGVGAAMIVGEDLQVAGSVSGGCIEGAVIEEALQVLKTGVPRKVSYGVEDEKAWSVGLSCGGQVTVFVERHLANAAPAVWQALQEAVQQNQPTILLTQLEPAVEPHLLVYPDGRLGGAWGQGQGEAVAAALEAYSQRLNQVVEIAGKQVFVQVFPRRDRLLIIGAVHITIPLVAFARTLDFETTVVDPRQVFATPERFALPPHHLVSQWPGQALSAWEFDDDTYAVLLTHDPKIDDEALHILLRQPVAYIGALGSRKTHAKRCERLREAGFGQEEITRIKGPAGLDIGARTPAEIALSIMAQITAVRRARQAHG
ncbi:MAG: XdhC family protein [Candidatus Latescibacteria bacterium]|nr:XdhC family protein [Candidatus Latescibacterota bacterium]